MEGIKHANLNSRMILEVRDIVVTHEIDGFRLDAAVQLFREDTSVRRRHSNIRLGDGLCHQLFRIRDEEGVDYRCGLLLHGQVVRPGRWTQRSWLVFDLSPTVRPKVAQARNN